MARQDVAKLAFRFVLIIGIVNFFADMTYEGAPSIVGPLLGSLGASAAIVGIVAGFGESAVAAMCPPLLAPIVPESSTPPFFCHSFSWALLQANSCVLQLRGFCFPGSSRTAVT